MHSRVLKCLGGRVFTPSRLRYNHGFNVILILDFGSQYTQLIARRVREANVYCEIHPFNFPLAKIRAMNPRGIILSGGPASLYEENAPDIDPEVLKTQRADSRHLLRHVCRRDALGREDAAIAREGVRPRDVADRCGRSALRRPGRSGASCVDEPRRSRRVDPAVVAIDRAYRECAVCGGAQHRWPDSRHPVSSRGRAYAMRHADPA